MNKFKIFFLFLTLGVVFSSCYKEENWIAENSETEDKYFPVIQKVTSTEDTLSKGEAVKLQVFYWSTDPIKEVELKANDDVVTLWAFTDSFDDEALAQVTDFEYIAPAVADTTDVKLMITVRNENGLIREKSVAVVVLP